jgi:riboflavin synthase
MFTGIIQAVGTVASIEKRGGDVVLRLNTAALELDSVVLGDSIAVNGVCLTVTSLSDSCFAADASTETLSLTSLGKLSVNSPVNLEKALTLSTPLGGHLVTGHVDGLGKILRRYPDGRSERFDIEAPTEISRYIAAKGSICIDGISLTVNSIEGKVFSVCVIPHTQGQTIMPSYTAGTAVNLEVDVIARYLERLITAPVETTSSDSNNDLISKLKSAGFIGQG